MRKEIVYVIAVIIVMIIICCFVVRVKKSTSNVSSLRFVKHISFYSVDSRMKYIHRMIKEANNYTYATDIFIHTNNHQLTKTHFPAYKNGSLTVVHHDLSDIHPYYLTWKPRDLMRQQKDDYDVFIYIEDDILVPQKTIDYWLTYNEKLIDAGYNLGFFRIETRDGEEYSTDLHHPLQMMMSLDGQMYILNDENPYCAFWIYNKQEFHRFLESEYYDIQNISGYEIREQSAIGLHGLQTPFYKGTLIPIIDGRVHKDSRVYHLPNNYASKLTIKFQDIVKY